jgi:hypothetical protein
VNLNALRAVVVCHTVADQNGRLTAGYLVRDLASRRDLGHVWWKPSQVGSPTWFWRTPDALHFGERSTRDAAIGVLRDAFDLAHGVDATRTHTVAPDASTSSTVSTSTTCRPTRPARTSSTAATSEPLPRLPRTASTQQINWATSSSDLTSAVADALRKGRS